MRICIVDDEASVRELITEVVRESVPDAVIEEFGDGQEAYQAFQESPNAPPDILITDWRMPGMDGIELASRMKQAKPELLVLLVTALAVSSEEMRGVVDVILPKPFGIGEFISRLRFLIRKLAPPSP